MVELQPVARDGRMSQLGSCYPNGGDEPNTSSSLPIRLHPGHGNSPQAPSAPVIALLIRVDLTGVLHGRRFCQDLWDCTDPRLPYPCKLRRRWLALPFSMSEGRINAHVGRRRLVSASARSSAEPTEVFPRMTSPHWGLGVLLYHSATRGKCAAVAMPLAVETPNLSRLPTWSCLST